MFYRTYFEENNTIIYNFSGNTGLNPVTELWYGSNSFIDGNTYTRFLFKVDVTNLRELYNNKQLISGDTSIKHTLKMFNTGFLESELIGKTNPEGRTRGYGFNLEVYRLDDQWTQGVRYDFPNPTNEAILGRGFLNFQNEPSNWFQATETNLWLCGEGAWCSGSTLIGTQNFPLGNENLMIDITEDLEDFIWNSTGNVVSYIIKYPTALENISVKTSVDTVGFYTRWADSFYEPFIETYSNTFISDDRNNFVLNKNNKLYLFANIDNELKNLDFKPSSVTVTAPNNTIISSYTSNEIFQDFTGSYYINLLLPSSTYNPNMKYKDTWSGIVYDGVNIQNITLDFFPRMGSNFFNIGTNVNKEYNNYTYNLIGIGYEEKFKSGVIRKIILQIYKRNYSYEKQKVIIDDYRYRIYVREGKNEIDVIPESKLHRSDNELFFYLDTNWLLPNEYYLQFWSKNANINLLRNESVKFTVIDPNSYPII